MSHTVSQSDAEFPSDYWRRHHYYQLNAEERAKIDIAEAARELSAVRRKVLHKAIDDAPISIHPDWVSFLWQEIQAYRDLMPQNHECARELEVEVARLVLKAIAEGRVTDPAALAAIVSDVDIPDRNPNPELF
ncbi:hypothetical protein [Minwuia thermotolerans]|uniref:Uncharacterized protein n=1 Tax=Minwuia thermotolerans TaxID=2056226 RepID=A0A2M9FWN7_9PROT|nr:hypothetical protein [Minwuia thermotolerans]PJK27864.1 hypothetical protein CVT23_20555 [Minwuia thermotolerans]